MIDKSWTDVYNNEGTERVLDKMKVGVDTIANPVKSTLGPCGRNVLVSLRMGTQVTKDGVTVARSIEPKDSVEATAATLMKQIAVNTVNECGDGTTTSTILAQALFNEGVKVLPYVSNRTQLKRDIEKKVKEVVEFLKSFATPVELNEVDNARLKQIATISANGDIEMANAIVEAFEMVKGTGLITIEESGDAGYKVERVDGFKVDAGYTHPYFMNDIRTLTYEKKNARILLMHKEVSSIKDLLPVLENLNGSPLVIFADSYTNSFQEIMIKNKLERGLDICLCKVQGYGDQKLDIYDELSAMTNARVFDTTSDVLSLPEYIGICDKIIVNQNETMIVAKQDRDATQFNELVAKLQNKLDECKNEHDKEKFANRLSKLVGGVAIIKVGGKTAAEIHERKDRVDDATNAVRSALAEGTIVGGARAFHYISNHMVGNEVNEASRIVQEALRAPMKTLCENAGVSYEYYDKLLTDQPMEFGVDFSKDSKDPENLILAGVIDPVKVLRVALESAVSVVSLLLTTDYVIVLNENKEQQD